MALSSRISYPSRVGVMGLSTQLSGTLPSPSSSVDGSSSMSALGFLQKLAKILLQSFSAVTEEELFEGWCPHSFLAWDPQTPVWSTMKGTGTKGAAICGGRIVSRKLIHVTTGEKEFSCLFTAPCSAVGAVSCMSCAGTVVLNQHKNTERQAVCFPRKQRCVNWLGDTLCVTEVSCQFTVSWSCAALWELTSQWATCEQ